jgi:hypothetical protein
MALHFRCSASEVVHHRAVRTTIIEVEEDVELELDEVWAFVWDKIAAALIIKKYIK